MILFRYKLIIYKPFLVPPIFSNNIIRYKILIIIWIIDTTVSLIKHLNTFTHNTNKTWKIYNIPEKLLVSGTFEKISQVNFSNWIPGTHHNEQGSRIYVPVAVRSNNYYTRSDKIPR